MTKKPKLVTHTEFVVVGTQINTAPKSSEIATLWSQFVRRIPEIKSIQEPGVCYGVMQTFPINANTLNYMAAVSVREQGSVPRGMAILTIPAGLYAVFEFPFADIGAAFCAILSSWLPSSGFSKAESPLFERYGENFDPNDPKSLVEAYIPVRPGAGNV